MTAIWKRDPGNEVFPGPFFFAAICGRKIKMQKKKFFVHGFKMEKHGRLIWGNFK